MDLKSYLNERGLSYRQFASQIGAASARTVQRYALNMRIPNRTMMAAIERETGGRVGPPDFYGALPTEQQPVSEKAWGQWRTLRTTKDLTTIGRQVPDDVAVVREPTPPPAVDEAL